MDSTNEAVRLRKNLAKSYNLPSFNQKDDDNTWTDSSSEINKLLVQKHFPGDNLDILDKGNIYPIYNTPELDDLFNEEAILWDINSVEKYKYTGKDDFFPINVFLCPS